MDTKTTLTVGDTLPNHLTITALETSRARASFTSRTLFNTDQSLDVDYWLAPSGYYYRQPVGTHFVHELGENDPERAIAEQLVAAQVALREANDDDDEGEEPDTCLNSVDGHWYVITYGRAPYTIHARNCRTCFPD